MIHEAMVASELLSPKGIGLRVVNSPWLNRMDREWMMAQVDPYEHVFVLEDHPPVGGFADFLLNELVSAGGLGARSFVKFAVDGYPACGTPLEVLRFHGLDGASLADRILKSLMETK